MKILFDLEATQPSFNSKYHGGGKYGKMLFWEFMRRNVPVSCVFDSTRFLDEKIQSIIVERGLTCHDLHVQSIENILSTVKPDVFYSPGPMRVESVPDGVKYIFTEHGIRETEMPADWMFVRYRQSLYQTIKTFIILLFNKWWKRVPIRRTAKLLSLKNSEFITVSEHTKYSCLSYFPWLNSERIKVFYSAATTNEDYEVKDVVAYKDYIFMVSANRPEKNVLRAIMAIDEIITENEKYAKLRIVVTGAKNDKVFRYKIKNRDNFDFKGYVSEDELTNLYRNCSFFVYPSLNEGFGYPPIEAMRFGKPVISSAMTSIAEICGDAAVYCNPFDWKEIKARILRMLEDREFYESQSRKSAIRYQEVTSRQDSDLKELVDHVVKE